MAGNIKGLTVEIDGNVTKLSKAIATVNTDAKKLQRELKGVTTLLDYDPKNVVLLEQKQQKLNKALSDQAVKLKELQDLDKAYADQLGPRTEKEAEDFENLQREIVATQKSLEAAKRALADFNIEQGVSHSLIGKLGAGLESFGSRVKPVGEHLESIGGKLTRTVTPAIAAAGAASIVAAVDIDTALTGVRKTVDGTEEQYQALKEAAIEFSETNAVSASQILDIQALGAQLGFAIDELDEFGQVVSGLDIATNMDAEQAATEMAQFANITKMSHDEIGNYGSAIVGLGNNFATTESDISAMAMRVAAAGTQVHMSQADILGLSTALTSMGVEAEAGGTAISTIMAQIDKDIAMSGSVMEGTSNLTQKEAEKVTGALETWASTAGMTAQEFSDAWKTDPVQALSALLSNMESTTAEGGNMSVMLQELGIDSVRQTDIMKRLAGNSDLVGEAVSKANAEWDANTALQKEVDNRNESLAAQFEMLKNRVIALADDVGGPLASALLDIVDQAEPLIKMISDGAKQFSEMSESEQRAVLQAVALSAALGPVLSIFGKGVQRIEGFGKGLQNLAKFFATVDVKVSGASMGLKDYDRAAKSSESATKKQTTAVKASSVAMGAAKTAALGVAGILAGMLLSAIFSVVNGMEEAKKRNEELDATNGLLSSSLDGLNSSADSAASSLDGYGITTASVKGKADDLKQAHADLAKSLNDTMTEAGASAGMLDSYMAVIEDLGSKSNLTEGDQARLKDAVDRVNEACGTTFAVTDDVNGALYGQVDAIRAVVSAQQDRLRYEAASEGLKDLYKQQETDLMRIAELEQQRNDLMDKHRGQTRAQWGEDAEVYNELGNALAEARDQSNATGDAVGRYEDRVGELGSALGSSTDDMAAFVSQSETLASVFEETGQSADGFADALSKCGASTTELADLSDEELAAIAQSYDGNIQSIVTKLQEFGIVAKEEGTNASTELASGLSEGADQAVAAAAEVTGASIDQIRADCAFFGIEGDAAITAYANAIANGGTQAQAAAAAAAAAGADGAEQTEQFGTSGQADVDAFAEAISKKKDAAVAAALEVTGMTIEQFNASAAQAGIEGDSAVASYANQIAAGALGAQNSSESVASSATSGLQTGDASAGGVLGAAFASLLGAQGLNANANATGVAGSATSGLGTGDASSGTTLGSQFAANVGSQSSTARIKGAGVATSAKGGLGSVSANGTGTNFVQGFVNGFYGVSIWDAAYSIGKSALSAIESALGIASPSKEAKKLGEFFVEGFAIPLEDGAEDLYGTGYDLAMSAYDGMNDASKKAGAIKMRLEALDADVLGAPSRVLESTAIPGINIRQDPNAIAGRPAPAVQPAIAEGSEVIGELKGIRVASEETARAIGKGALKLVTDKGAIVAEFAPLMSREMALIAQRSER